MPFNKLKYMWDTDVLSDKDQSDAYAADIGAINKWATAIGGASGLTLHNQQRGEQMLSQAQSLDAHRVVIERMRKEGAAALKGIQDMRNNGQPAQGGAAAPGAGGGATQRHMLNNREIVPNADNTGWVYKDTKLEAR